MSLYSCLWLQQNKESMATALSRSDRLKNLVKFEGLMVILAIGNFLLVFFLEISLASVMQSLSLLLTWLHPSTILGAIMSRNQNREVQSWFSVKNMKGYNMQYAWISIYFVIVAIELGCISYKNIISFASPRLS